MKLVTALALAGAPFVLAPLANAQSTYYFYDQGTRQIGAIESTAGYVIRPRLTPPIPGGASRELEPVGNEVWAAFSTGGLRRYDATTLAFISEELTNYRIRAIVPDATGGATLFGINDATTDPEALAVDGSASVTGTTTLGYAVADALAAGGDFLAIVENDVVRVDGSTFQIAGVGITGAEALATANATVYAPARLFAIPGGSVAVSSDVNIVVADPSGAARQLYNVGVFELGAVAGSNGELAIPSINRVTWVDIATGAETDQAGLGYGTSRLNISSYSRPTGGGSARICAGGANSTGDAARASVLASADALNATLTLVGNRMPPGQTALPVYGMEGAPITIGTGQLCIQPGQGSLVRAPVTAVGADGSTETLFDFMTPGLGAEFAVGTTWVFQVAFRDTGGMGVGITDAVKLTFQP